MLGLYQTSYLIKASLMFSCKSNIAFFLACITLCISCNNAYATQTQYYPAELAQQLHTAFTNKVAMVVSDC